MENTATRQSFSPDRGPGKCKATDTEDGGVRGLDVIFLVSARASRKMGRQDSLRKTVHNIQDWPRTHGTFFAAWFQGGVLSSP